MTLPTSTRPKRPLSADEEAIIDELYRLKAEFKPYSAYVTAAAELTLRRWNGEGRSDDDKNWTTEVVPPGRTLKIVMISRMEHFGLTSDLDAENGYGIRLDLDDAAIKDIRWTPETKGEESNHGTQD